MSPEELIAAQETLHGRLTSCYDGNSCKPTCTNHAGLGKLKVDRIPLEKLGHPGAVIDDLGEAQALKVRLRKHGHGLKGVCFFACSEKVASEARALGFEVTLVPPEKLDLFISRSGEYSYLRDMKFAYVIGNPPFQPDVKKGDGKGNGSGNKIWQKFIELAFDLAEEDGHLLFVTPHNWRTGNFKSRAQHRQAQQLIFDNDVQWWIDARNDDGVDHFPTIGNSNSVDAWHVVKGQKGELPAVLRNLCLLPKSSDPETLAKVAHFFEVCEREEALEWHGCDSTGRGKDLEKSSQGDATHPFRVAGTSAQVRDGVYHWSFEKRATSDLRKVMVCDSGQPVIGYDDGTMANGRHTGCYSVGNKEEGDRLVSFLQSPLVKFISSQFMRDGALGFPMELFERVPKRVLTVPWEEVFK